MKIARALLDQLHGHLEAGYPHEACGLLLGRSGCVTETVAADNTRTDSAHNRYLIDPLAYSRIERDADRRGLQVLGIYHSHPDQPARPPFDLENAWPNFSYLIVSVAGGCAVETNSWTLRDDERQFCSEPVEISE